MDYEFLDGSCYVTNAKGERNRVSNFNANIIKEFQRIDEKAVSRSYVIAGKNEKGENLPPVEVTADEFTSLGWVGQKWGSKAIIFPTPSAKDGLRTAIQLLSDPDIEPVYIHTGWAEIKGQWVFLANNHSIGKNGPRSNINVDLPKDLDRYTFPSKTSTPREAIEATFMLPRLLGLEVGYLLLATAFRAPIGTDFAVHITGRTGTFKSEIAACAQSFFGVTTARELPASWSSTPNALEALAYRAKDALMVIDDFIPVGTSYQQRAYQTTADRIIRAVGNQAGRARLTDVSGHQQTMWPRAMILSTGEDTPEGHSVRARMIITELSPGEIKPEDLTQAQRSRPLYNEAMAGFLAWAAADICGLRKTVQLIEHEIRDDNLSVGHSRTPTTLGKLIGALWALTEYAKTIGVTDAARHHILDEGTDAILEIASRQQSYLQAADPADQFIQVLRGIFGANAAHLKARNGGVPKNAIQFGWIRLGEDDWKPHGPRLGWEAPERNTVYLDAQVAYDTIRRHSRGAVTLTRATLYKRLREAGHLTETDQHRQRNTVRVTLENATRTVIALNLQTLLTQEIE